MIAVDLTGTSYNASLLYRVGHVHTPIALENCTRQHFEKIPSTNKRINNAALTNFLCLPIEWSGIIGGQTFSKAGFYSLYLLVDCHNDT